MGVDQGVAIIVAIKSKNESQSKSATLHHFSIWGTREHKYKMLLSESIKTLSFQKIYPTAPFFFFAPRNAETSAEYEQGISVAELFQVTNNGIKTDRDSLFIHQDKDALIKNITHLLSGNINDEFKIEHNVKDSSSYKLTECIRNKAFKEDHILNIEYRPFDRRYIYYDPAIISRPAQKVSTHLLAGENISLITARSNKTGRPDHFFVSRFLSEAKTGESSTQSCIMPLYRYEAIIGGIQQKTPNLNEKIYAKIKKKIPDVKPEILFDYIYAVLHSPTYRDRYADFLKSDFPRITYPVDQKIFHALAEKGAGLRALHLMESPALENFITTYPVDGDHEVTKPAYKDGKVWINDKQYFGNLPETAWNFYIGGYQPAQKWLKDRRGSNLSIDDIMHYQRVIVALNETDRIMQDIDKIDFLPKSE